MREFEDSFGRVMKAELVSHTGADADTVKIRKATGRSSTSSCPFSSDDDQAAIREWMKATRPP